MTASPVTPPPRRCEALKVDGTECKARPLRGEVFCLCHHPAPDRREQHQKVSARGGAASWRSRIELASVENSPSAGLLCFLLDVMVELRQPDIPPSEVNRLKAAVYCAATTLRVIEVIELKAQLQEVRLLVDIHEKRERDGGKK